MAGKAKTAMDLAEGLYEYERAHGFDHERKLEAVLAAIPADATEQIAKLLAACKLALEDYCEPCTSWTVPGPHCAGVCEIPKADALREIITEGERRGSDAQVT